MIKIKPNTIYQKNRRTRKRAAGICIECSNKALESRSRCTTCLQKDRERQRKYKEKIKRREEVFLEKESD